MVDIAYRCFRVPIRSDVTGLFLQNIFDTLERLYLAQQCPVHGHLEMLHLAGSVAEFAFNAEGMEEDDYLERCGPAILACAMYGGAALPSPCCSIPGENWYVSLASLAL